MLWILTGSIIFFGTIFGLAWPVTARLALDPAEKLVASATLSLIAMFVVGWAIYVFGLPESLLWGLPIAALVGIATARRALLQTLTDSSARELIAGQTIVAAWCLGWLALVSSYSGGGWTADWFEHWERARFFLEGKSRDFLFLGHYPLPARPPLANIVTGTFLHLGRGDFPHYQVIATLLGSLAFLPAALWARRFAGKGGGIAALVVLLLLNPLFVQNATFAWTKLPAAFLVLTSLYFFWKATDRAAPANAILLGGLSLAAGILTHYSAAPYAVVGFVAWMIRSWSRWRDGAWRQNHGWAFLASAGVLSLWFGWSLMTFGWRGTFLSNTSVTGTAQSTGAQFLNVALNVWDTLVPHFFRRFDEALIAQTSSWGMWRDWWFQLYQLNLLFAFGSTAGLAILAALVQARKKFDLRQRMWLAGALAVIVVLGVAVNGPRDHWGLTHICLQPLVVFGLAFLAGSWGRISPGWRRVVVAGVAVDFVLGIALHFAVQSQALDRWLHPSWSAERWISTYNPSATMNYYGKLGNRVEFLRDVQPLPDVLLVALLASVLGLALYRVGTRRES